jgi:uncharacterized protein YciI
MNPKDLLEGLPSLTSAEIEQMIGLAQNYALVLLRKGPASRDDAMRNTRLQLAHLQHLAKLQLAEKLVLNGPIIEEHDILGVSIYATTVEEAEQLASADPKVKAGYLTVEVIPWMAVNRAQMTEVYQHLL